MLVARSRLATPALIEDIMMVVAKRNVDKAANSLPSRRVARRVFFKCCGSNTAKARIVAATVAVTLPLSRTIDGHPVIFKNFPECVCHAWSVPVQNG